MDNNRRAVKPFIALTAALAVSGALTTCAQDISGGEREPSRMAGVTITEVLKRHTEELMSIPGVVGTAVGECGGRPCIMVLVLRKTNDVTTKIPSELEGFPLVVEETGAIRPLETKAEGAKAPRQAGK